MRKPDWKQAAKFLAEYFRPVVAHRWVGAAGIITACVFLAGRALIEPVRILPRYDEEGMDAYHTAELFRVRDNVVRGNARPIRGIALGSSVSIWGIVPEIFEREIGLPEKSFVNGAVQGGVTFQSWTMVRRNQDLLSDIKIALIEVNPRALSKGMDDDDRIQLSVRQYATFEERMMVSGHETRRIDRIDYFLPFWSARRPLSDVVRNVVQPVPGDPLYDYTGGRLTPYRDWFMEDTDPAKYEPHLKVAPERAAEMIIGRWKISTLEDESMRKTLDWFRDEGALIILHGYPTHPLAVEAIRKDKKHMESMRRYEEYLKTLGVPEDQMFVHFEIGECGVPEVGMRDFAHFNQIGAEAYCHCLGGKIRELCEKKGL